MDSDISRDIIVSFFYRSGTHRLTTDCDVSRKSWSHTRTGQHVFIADTLALCITWCSLQPVAEGPGISEEKRKTLVECALFMGSFLKWDLGFFEKK